MPLPLLAALSTLPLAAACQQRYDHVSHPIPYKNTDRWATDTKPEEAKAVSVALVSEKKKSPLDFVMRDNAGQKYFLSQHKGKVVLLVNTASRCGYTRQYQGLQSLHDRYKDRGLVVIAVPSNDFNEQEPGDDAHILAFCQSKFHVTFPVMAKTSVKGDAIHPLYEYLTTPQDAINPAAAPGLPVDPYLAAPEANKFKGPIRWNFEKLLIGRNGQVVDRFPPAKDPREKEVIAAVEAELAKKAN